MTEEVAYVIEYAITKLSEAVIKRFEKVEKRLEDFEKNSSRSLETMREGRDWYFDQLEISRKRAERLEREVRYLRHYGNKDCTAMADEALMRGDLDEEASRD